MPSSRGYITMARRSDEVPGTPISFSDLETMWREGDLGTASRGAWLTNVLEQILEPYGAQRLSYLCREATVLDPSAVKAAIEALRMLIQRMSVNPSYLYELTRQDMFSAAEIAEILNGPPNLQGPPRYGDDGDDLLFLAWFLRAHLSILELADSSGKIVLCGQSEEPS